MDPLGCMAHKSGAPLAPSTCPSSDPQSLPLIGAYFIFFEQCHMRIEGSQKNWQITGLIALESI